MRISDWSSDVCSSDLPTDRRIDGEARLDVGPDRIPHMIEEQFIALGPQRLVAAVMFGVDRSGVAEAERDGFGGRVGEMKDIFVERGHRLLGGPEIGRASCRERVCQYG